MAGPKIAFHDFFESITCEKGALIKTFEKHVLNIRSGDDCRYRINNK